MSKSEKDEMNIGSFVSGIAFMGDNNRTAPIVTVNNSQNHGVIVQLEYDPTKYHLIVTIVEKGVL